MNTSRLLLLLTFFAFFVGCRKDDDNGNDVGTVSTMNNPTDGQIVVSTYTTPYTTASRLLVLDKNGNVLSKKDIPVAAGNFRKWVVDGKTRYTYCLYDSNAYKITTGPGIIPCTGIVLDENMQEIKRIRLLPYNGRTATDPTAIDSHEFLYLGDNHFITLSYFQKPVTNIPASLNPISNCPVVAPIIQEIVNDAVVWEWDGTQYPEFYTQSVEGNAFSNPKVVHDYIHMNSIIVDPTDNNLICSLRHLNQVIKISHADGHIIWRLGGTNSTFPLAADKMFLRQHSASLTDNNRTLMLFDNGEITQRAYSRIAEFHFNASQTAIDSSSSYPLPMNIFGQYMGSVQKRGDTYFIDCGSTPKLLEVNYKTNQVTFMMDLSYVSYRAYKN